MNASSSSGELEPARLPLDTRIGAYRVLSRVGRGGMGEVWLAEHTLLGRRAAIKVLRPNLSTEEEMVSRFFNEARAAASIADPGIVQIFDFGYHVDGSAYIVMELLDGEPLDKRLARVGSMSIPDALRTIKQIASSLGAAHARNIVHRDLKPENIFLVPDPEVAGGERAKILDFGIAKLGDLVGAKKTKTAALIGTPLYMSPEQCRGASNVDARTDIYALGCLCYELIVGAPPYDATGLGELLAQHIASPVPRASSRLMALPPAVDELIARCMAKQPADRFANGAELAHAVGEVLEGRKPPDRQLASTAAIKLNARKRPPSLATGTGTLAPAPAQDVARLEQPDSMDDEEIEPPRRRGHVLALAGLGAVALGVAGFVLVVARSSPHAAAPPQDPVVAPAVTPTPPAAPTAASPPPSPAELARPAIAATAAAFAVWARSHAGAPCPSNSELGSNVDPWGRALAITCTNQPGDQRIGIMSAGPDGKVGTGDDIASWYLGPELLDSLRGSRWAPRVTVRKAPPAAPHAVTPAAPPPSLPVRGKSFTGTSLGVDGIPTSR